MRETFTTAKQSVYQVYGLLGFTHNVSTNQPQLVFKYLTNNSWSLLQRQKLIVIYYIKKLVGKSQ